MFDQLFRLLSKFIETDTKNQYNGLLFMELRCGLNIERYYVYVSSVLELAFNCAIFWRDLFAVVQNRPIQWPGEDLGISRPGWIFKKEFESFVDFFLGRPNWFSELSRSSTKTLKGPVSSKFYFANKILQKKQTKKSAFRHFLENVDKKVAFLRCSRSPFKIIINWRQ